MINNKRNVVWTPQEKQLSMLSRGETEGFYGGAAGGGKTDYLTIDALREVDIPHYRGLVVRRSVPELAQLLDRAQCIYPQIYPKAKFNETKHTWTFPSGAQVRFASLYHAKDKYKFQGLSYDFIGMDELCQFTYDEASYLMSRNRANGPGTHVRFRGTGNPGGIGMGWVKQHYISPTKPGKRFWRKFTLINPDGKIQIVWKSYIFIQSSVFDNQILLQNNPEYLATLAALPEQDKNALLYGSWDSFEGQVFIEWRNDPQHYKDRHWTHVIEPFTIPQSWQIIRSFDWGYSKPFSVGWFAVDNDGRYYRIKELYGCGSRPNTGVKWTNQQIAQRIKEIEKTEPNLKYRDVIGYADPAIFQQDGSGSSIANDMAKYGIYWNKGDNSRIAGKMQYHYRLAFDENGIPMMYVFSNCKNFIRTIPNLIYSENQVEDIDTDTEDHQYDESRYAVMANILPARKSSLYTPYNTSYDPLDIKHSMQEAYYYMNL